MDTYVISLKHSADRRAHIARQLSAADVRYEFFDAIEANQAYRHFNDVRTQEFRIATGRAVSPSEAGCYASHLCLWKRCVELQKPLLILEDDAEIIDPCFPAALSQVAEWIEEFGYIRLQTNGRRRPVTTILARRSPGFDLYLCTKFPYGSMCYAISPDVAGAFLKSSRVMAGPVDLFIKRFWVHGCPLYAIDPPAVTHSEHSLYPTIKHRTIDTPSLTLRTQRSMYKLRGAIARARFVRSLRCSLSNIEQE